MSMDRHFNPLVLDNPFRKILDRKDRVLNYVKGDMIVADIGCGPGFYTIKLSKIAKTVYAVDSDKKMIDVLNKKIEKLGIKNVVTQVTSANNLKIEPETVDFVFSNGVLCCMVDHKGAINEIYRILKPKGKAYISVETLSKGKTSVSENEWKELLSRFKIIKEEKKLFTREAIVEKSEGD
ncbi:class I SAM-dependent methyltransferase [Caldisphaera sp.]|uniref:class I SAM-dependent methyltransferase n=1 Tax=Caldisphaera sp. TaxID=2060322 RepID=UPI003D0CA7D7